MRVACLFLVLFSTMATSEVVLAQNRFRVSNEIFAEGREEPIMKTLTLFTDETVYDFAYADAKGDVIEQATLYDFTRNRFILVDYVANAKVEITQEMLLRYLAELTNQVESKDPLLKEAANPKFEITQDENLIKFTGDRIKYEVKTFSPTHKSAAADYLRFADWSARLTTLQFGQPPMARIAVNRELAKESLMPKQVVLIRSQGPIWENAKKLRSEHIYDWQLTKTDAKRIETLDTKMAKIETLSWADFNAKKAAAKPENKKR